MVNWMTTRSQKKKPKSSLFYHLLWLLVWVCNGKFCLVYIKHGSWQNISMLAQNTLSIKFRYYFVIMGCVVIFFLTTLSPSNSSKQTICIKRKKHSDCSELVYDILSQKNTHDESIERLMTFNQRTQFKSLNHF